MRVVIVGAGLGGLTLAAARKGTTGWHPLIDSLVSATKADTVGVRGYYDKEPAAPDVAAGVWLLGDAAHPMCPVIRLRQRA